MKCIPLSARSASSTRRTRSVRSTRRTRSVRSTRRTRLVGSVVTDDLTAIFDVVIMHIKIS